MNHQFISIIHRYVIILFNCYLKKKKKFDYSNIGVTIQKPNNYANKTTIPNNRNCANVYNNLIFIKVARQPSIIERLINISSNNMNLNSDMRLYDPSPIFRINTCEKLRFCISRVGGPCNTSPAIRNESCLRDLRREKTTEDLKHIHADFHTTK